MLIVHLLLAMHTLICVTFSLPSGVGGWLRLLLVVLPGLFFLPLFIMSLHVYIMHLNYDTSYLKAHDSISFDVIINYMLDGIPYLCTCNFTVCLS